MEQKINQRGLRGRTLLPVECPVGCGFFILCWLVSAEDIPEEMIWLCLGKSEDDPLDDVPIGAWACRPITENEIQLGNG